MPLIDLATKIAVTAKAVEIERKYGYVRPAVATAERLRQLVQQGWKLTYSALFGPEFVEALADHHEEAIEWHWDSRLALLEGKTPDYWAYFPIWSRGHLKSTIARRIAVVEAVLSFAFDQPAYILYISRNSAMAKKHALSIETLLTSPRVKQYCPQLSVVKRNVQGSSRGWQATFLNTEAGVYHFGGLDEGMAGGNVDDVRPTAIFLDDIDGREDSPVVAEARFIKLTTEVLPMRQGNTLVFFPQNFINRYSTQFRIHSGQVRVLTNRKPTEPIPAILDLETEQRTVGGIIQDVIINGVPTWHKYGLERCQEEINTIGLEAFKRECQHLVAEAREGLVLHAYNDSIHVISESEFGAVYGSPDAWKEFYKVPFNDWARTKTEKHANVAGYMAVSSQNTRLPGMTFCIPLSFPAETMPEDVAERLLSILTPNAYGENGTSVRWKKLIRDAHLRANAGEHFDTLAKRVDYERSHLKAVIPKYSRPVLRRYNVKIGAMSHSEDTVRTIFNDVFGFNFQPANPHKLDCIEEINSAFKIDWNADHPFRLEKGYTRTFIIAPDDLSAEPRMENNKAIYPPLPYPKQLQPHELHDSNLLRFQFCNYRFAEPVLTSTGERIDDLLKLNDDFFQGWQMVWFKKLLTNIRIDKSEMEELTVTPKFRLSNIEAKKDEVSEEEYGQMLITRQSKLVLPKILSGSGKPKSRFAKFQR